MKKKILFIMVLLLLVGISAGIIKAIELGNDVRVEKNTTLTYYLNVKYDGVDVKGIKSSDTATADIRSGYIYVEDKIPEGLIFDSFVETEDGTIGAVKRSDGSSCTGYVVDGVKGLKYDAITGIVSFKVKSLQAGCELTVGINTITPVSIDDPNTDVVEKRRDFYNAATATEETVTAISNTVHAWMGSEEEQLYDVKYQYTGDVPNNAPALPSDTKYAENTTVGVGKDAILEGYRFTGWTTTDVEVTNGKFTMPNKQVTLIGGFEKINPYEVKYEIEGIVPNGYVVPFEKEYYPNSNVNVDSLKVGDVINGYKFLGWTTVDATITEDNDFLMPEKNVTIVGKFEEVKYKVIYKFYDGILPSNSESILPATKSYKAGDNVTLQNVLDEPTGYKFLGWYKEDNFEMSEEDVVIYGEWKIQEGTFEPTIKKEVASTKKYYKAGDTVRFKITITNTASFPIREILVKENNVDAKFVSGNGYVVESEHFASISILDAGKSIEIYSEYIVDTDDTDKVINEVEIKGALASGNYTLKEKEYKATAEVNIESKLKICKEVNDENIENTFQFNILSEDNTYETWINLSKKECKTINIAPGKYKIKEIVPQEYKIKEVKGSDKNSEQIISISQGSEYTITYVNEFRKKGFLHSFGRVVNKIVGGN